MDQEEGAGFVVDLLEVELALESWRWNWRMASKWEGLAVTYEEFVQDGEAELYYCYWRHEENRRFNGI